MAGWMIRAAQAVVDRVWSARALRPRDPALADWFGGGGVTATGVNVTPETALRCPAVYASVGLLADTVATIPLDLFRITGPDSSERATDHPLHALMHDRPNDWQTSAELRQDLMTHLCTWGNGYGRIFRRGDGTVRAIEPLYPSRVQPFRRPAGGVAYRYLPESGPQQILMPDEVLHLKRRPFNYDSTRGRSPVELHSETIGLAMAASEYLSRFFGNSAVPKGAIEIPVALTDKSAELLRASWERRHQGLENAHRLAILDGGMKFHELGMSNEDGQVLEIYRHLVAEIAARVYGIPPHLIGETEKSTSWGTGIEQQSIGFVVYFIRPWLVAWEQALNATLLSSESRRTYKFEFNVDGLLRGDFKTRIEGLALMVQWGLATPNEARRLMNLAPLAGGDSRLQPLNMAPADKVLDILLKPSPQATRMLDDLAGGGGPADIVPLRRAG